MTKKSTDYLDESIIDQLKIHKELRIKQILEIIGTSRMTLYRGLKRLESKEFVETEHGKVRLHHSIEIEPNFTQKVSVNYYLKEQIASWVVQNLVPHNSIIAMESGTSVAACIPFLKEKKPGSILSNGINVEMLCTEYLTDVDIFCCGGLLRRKSMSFTGDYAVNFFTSHHADIALVSATGITLEHGIMDNEVQAKKAICNCSSKSVLLADSSKFNKLSLKSFGPLDSVDIIVTDSHIDPDLITEMRKQSKVEIVIAH